MAPSLEGSPTKAKEAPSPQEVRLDSLDTNPVFQYLREFHIGITLLDVHLNWLNRFHFLILEGGLLVVLVDCIIFLSAFLDGCIIFLSACYKDVYFNSFFPRKT